MLTSLPRLGEQETPAETVRLRSLERAQYSGVPGLDTDTVTNQTQEAQRSVPTYSRVDVEGKRVDVKGNRVDVKGNHVDVKGNHVDV
eukprot:1186973-Prorocentrum_minimum.AAC.1